MKKVFLDTNVILDWLFQRDESGAAKKIMQCAANRYMNATTSILSMANVAYLARKGRTRTQLYEIMAYLTHVIKTLPMDELQLKATIAQPVTDFEDMLQYQCAVANGCDFIVTRNTKHFQFSQLPLYTPEAFADSFPSVSEKTN